MAGMRGKSAGNCVKPEVDVEVGGGGQGSEERIRIKFYLKKKNTSTSRDDLNDLFQFFSG